MHRTHRIMRKARPALVTLAIVTWGAAAGAQASGQAEPPPGAEPTTDAATPAPNPDAAAKCATSFERSQTERLAGHYIAAKAEAQACSQLECHPAIVRECVKLYDALERDTPTLVVSARKGEGGELIDVRVEMDGKLVAESITGRPFAVDPGPHHFVFVHPERGRVELTSSARVGERARVIEATFVDPLAKKPPPAPAPAAPRAPPRASRGIPVASYVLGGVGVVGIGGFVFLRLSAVSDYNHYADTCSPACNPDDVDAVDTKFTLSYVSLGVGAASLAGAVLVYAFSRGDGKGEVQASIVPRPDGAVAGLRTRF